MGHDAWIINYQNPRHHWGEFVKPWFVMRRPRTVVNYITKRLAFRRDWRLFRQTRFTTSADCVNGLDFDAVVVGSDVVWDVSLFGGDELYFGNIRCAPKVIAYAASCGTLPSDYDLPLWASAGLRKFSHIMVRDQTTARLVERCLDYTPKVVLDPCLLHNIVRLEEKHPGRRRIIPRQPYLLVYAYELEPFQIEAVRGAAAEMGLVTVAAGYYQSWCDINLISAGPLDVLSLCRQASCMVAGTFHGTIFALSFDIPFVAHTPPAVVAKVTDLFGRLSLEERLDFNLIGDLLRIPPRVASGLERMRQRSREFLIEGLAE